MDLTPQRGAFSRVLNRLARSTKIVFSPQRGGLVGLFVCTIILQIPFVCVTGAALELRLRTPYGHDASTWSSGKVEADGAKHTLPCG